MVVGIILYYNVAYRARHYYTHEEGLAKVMFRMQLITCIISLCVQLRKQAMWCGVVFYYLLSDTNIDISTTQSGDQQLLAREACSRSVWTQSRSVQKLAN